MRSTTLVVEGPDGAGKSTLVDHLSRVTGLRAIHTGGALKTKEEALKKIEELVAVPKPVIFDRFITFSDPIYKEAMERPQVLDQDTLWSAWQRIQPAVVIYCRPPNGVMNSNLVNLMAKSHKPQYYVDEVKARHPKIVELYDRMMAKAAVTWRARVVWFDYTQGTDALSHALTFVDRRVA